MKDTFSYGWKEDYIQIFLKAHERLLNKSKPEGKDEPSKDTVDGDNLFLASVFCCQVCFI